MASSKHNTESSITLPSSNEVLCAEATELLNNIVNNTDPSKQQQLVNLFNLNQQKKTLVRMDKYGEILDLSTSMLIQRLAEHPEEFDTKQVVDTLKAVQDLMNKSKDLMSTQDSQPGPTINGPVINISANTSQEEAWDRDKRKRVDDVLSAIFNSMNKSEIIDADIDGDTNENK